MRLLGLLCLLWMLPAAAETTVNHFYGYAYDLDSDRYIYTEVHEQEIVDGVWTRGSIRYYDAEGTLIGGDPLDTARDQCRVAPDATVGEAMTATY